MVPVGAANTGSSGNKIGYGTISLRPEPSPTPPRPLPCQSRALSRCGWRRAAWGDAPGRTRCHRAGPALLLTCYSSSAKICHTLGATSLGKAVLSLLGVFHPNPITCPTMPHLSISWQQEEPIRNHQPQCQDCKNPTSAQIQNATKNKAHKFVGGVEYQKSVIGKICSLLIFSCFD